MRLAGLIVVAVLAACASAVGGDDGGEKLGRLPFPVERGSALPPPAPSANGAAAPPEGRSPGGIDFGQWRNADPASYGPAFQAQIRQRYANQSAEQIRADLQANGFACAEGRLDCRIEIMERQCAFDWYVVADRTEAGPVAGFDQMCLGAN